jgi:hypothetical protein
MSVPGDFHLKFNPPQFDLDYTLREPTCQPQLEEFPGDMGDFWPVFFSATG